MIRLISHVTAWAATLALATSLASGATNWTQLGNTDRWSNPANWDSGVPTSVGDDVLFSPQFGPREPLVDLRVDGVAGNLVVDSPQGPLGVTVRDSLVTIDGFADPGLQLNEIKLQTRTIATDSGVASLTLRGLTATARTITTNALLSGGGEFQAQMILKLVDARLELDNLTSVTDPDLNWLDLRLESGSVLGTGSLGFDLPATGILRISGGSRIDSELLSFNNDGPTDVGVGGGVLTTAGTLAGPVRLSTSAARLTFADDLLGRSRTSVLEGEIIGPGGITVDGPNRTVELRSSNSFSGGIFLEAGVVEVSRGANLGSLQNFLQFSGGTLRTTSNFTIGIDSFINGVGGIDTDGNNVSVSGDFTGVVTGVFTKSGAGTLTLNNNGSAYAGDFLVESGTLVSGNGDTFGNLSTVAVASGATLRFDSAENFDGLNGDGSVDVNGQSLRLGTNDTQSNDFAGQLTGSGAILMSGAGVQRFSGDNSGFTGTLGFTGDADGALVFARVESLGRDIDVPSGTVVEFDLDSGESDHSHAFSGSGIVYKNGAGTLNLTNDSPNFDGAVLVSGGTLNMNGTHTLREAEVSDGGALGGDGTINGPLRVYQGSSISPGNSVGKLTVSSYRMRAETVLAVELTGDGSVAGVDHDQLVVTGDARIDDATLSVSLVDGFVPSHGDEFHVLSIGGAITGAGFTQFDLPEVPGMAWDTSAVLPQGLIAIEVLLPGDYNLDGTVDAADYTVWRDHVGAPAGALASDIDGGDIGDAQYQTWAINFGRTLPPAVQAVPEPTAKLLLVLAAGFVPSRPRRPRLLAEAVS